MAEEKINAQEKMETFWNNLNEEDKKLFDKMFNEAEHFSANDFKEKFGNILGFKDIYSFIEDYYKESISSI
jgi:hypothetical protein